MLTRRMILSSEKIKRLLACRRGLVRGRPNPLLNLGSDLVSPWHGSQYNSETCLHPSHIFRPHHNATMGHYKQSNASRLTNLTITNFTILPSPDHGLAFALLALQIRIKLSWPPLPGPYDPLHLLQPCRPCGEQPSPQLSIDS